MPQRIVVRSNVRRDLLQSAAVFRNEKLVVWEYVSNSLQYVDAGVNPEAHVTIDSRGRRIVVVDNGRGMKIDGLQNFFIMHGENIDRRSGRRGRGRFGTGKSAAFGIASTLRVTTVQGGLRSKVELTKEAINSAGDDEVPLEILESEVPCKDPNGTMVEIERIHLRRMNPDVVMRYIERHLARWPGRARVLVNDHECEPREPTTSQVITRAPAAEETPLLGNITLTLKVATAPLEEEQRGVSIYANRVWLESTLAGLEGQSMANYIFGEVDVPELDDEDAPIPAYDLSRSMQLNRSNPIVQTLLGFLGREIDHLRRKLVRADSQRRAAEEARRLQREADRIADLINQDFAEFSNRLERSRSRGGSGRERMTTPTVQGDSPDLLRSSKNGVPASHVSDTGGPGNHSSGGTSSNPGAGPLLSRDARGTEKGQPLGHTPQTRRRGGFRVEFDYLGDNEHRAKYSREERVIFVNLDHQQVRVALRNVTVEDINFRRLAYEIAFAEYAIALASELASSGEYLDPSDPIFDVRETLNRMANRSAQHYTDSAL